MFRASRSSLGVCFIQKLKTQGKKFKFLPYLTKDVKYKLQCSCNSRITGRKTYATPASLLLEQLPT
jgi:hypothetical protein